MAEKTIVELKKLFLVISKEYQEYKKVVAQLKHVLNERGNTIMNNKLEIFSLRKDGSSGPPEDEEFFKICHTMQTRLLKSHTEAYYKDFKDFEKNIENKFRMMETELERLQRIGILWDEKQNPVENMSKIIIKKEVEITALKQEMSQLFRQKQQDRIQITTLEQESKPTTEKIMLLKQSYEKERSIRRQIFEQLRQAKGDCRDLDAKLKIALEENNGLQEKYQKESSLHKNTKGTMKRLQGQFHQMVQEKNCLQSKYEKDTIECKLMKEALGQTIEELQTQLKETVKAHKCIETNYEKEKSSHKNTKETLNQLIEDLQGQLHEIVQEHSCLKNNYEKEKCLHKNTKEALDKVIEELQVQLHQVVQENKDLEETYQKQISTATEELEQTKKELINNSENQVAKCKELQVQMQSVMKENKALEENYQQEKSQYKNTKEELEQSIKELRIQLKQANDQNKVMCNTIEQLEVNLQQGEEKIISIEEKYLKEVDAHGIKNDMFSQTAERFQDKINQGREGNQNFEEKYEDEKSSHKETQEELVQANQQNKEKSAKIKELEFQLQQAVEENTWTNETYRKERSAHKHTKKQLNCLEEIYEKEKSERINTKELEHLQRTLEELDQAKCENKIMKEKLEEIEQLRGNGKNYEDLQVPQPQTQDKQFKEDLHACLSVISDTKTLKQRFIAMKRRYLDNEQLQISEIVEQECQLENKDLVKKLYGCQNLLKVKSDTISRLEQQLLTAVQQCAEREKKYVKILNRHIVMEHQLKKELEKVSKPIPQRVSSWWHEKVLKSNIFDTSQDDEEELNLYPEDWRLPEFPDDEKLLDI